MKIGLLIEGPEVDSYVAAAVEEMLAKTEAEVTLVVENVDDSWLDQYLKTVWNDRLWATHHAIRLVARRIRGRHDYRELVDLRTIVDFDDVNHVTCTPEPTDGFGNEVPADVSEAAQSVDVLVRFGFGFLVGDVLNAPTHGTLSFHHGDFRKYRGRPAGFWEFLHGEEEVGITLQRLNDTLDAGEVVVEKTIRIDDCDTWQAIKHRLFTESSSMLAEGIQQLSREEFTPTQLTDIGSMYTRPAALDYLRYLWKNTTGRL